MQMDAQVGVNGIGGGSSRDGPAGAGVVKRGTKRDASDSNLNDIARYTKRFHLLNLNDSEQNNGHTQSHLYTPVSNAPAESSSNGVSHANHMPPLSSYNESMQVDDTRDRVYIHDLDKELEEVESNAGKERLIFLPDIEKHFSKLPQHLLTGGQSTSQELVLSRVPKSLTVDENHDSVRKAIIESRQRAREKAVEEARHTEAERNYDHAGYVGSMLDMEPAQGYRSAFVEEHHEHEHDPDAMDIG